MAYNFLRGDRDQPFLLPPDLRDWLPYGHLAWFILDVVDQVDLQPFYLAHRDDGRGHPAYDPKLLLGVLLYGYCIGVRSSRQLERRCVEDIAFRVLAANQTPDHVTIARLRVRHEQALAGFLVQSLKLCAAAGMVRVGVVAPGGYQLARHAADKANRTLDRLEREVAEILRQAADVDRREDRLFGDARGDELLGALTSKAGRLARLLQTRRGRVQGYNAQAVTTVEQVIVAAELTQDANDFQQLEPMLTAISRTLAAAGIPERPGTLAADSGYWSIANLTELPNAPQLLIPPPKHGRHGKPRKDGKPSQSNSDGLRAAMTAKLQSEDGKACYAKRKETVEPVFGQIKDGRGARRLLRRGLAACEAECKLLCGTHNLLKLWRHTRASLGPEPLTTRSPLLSNTLEPVNARTWPNLS